MTFAEKFCQRHQLPPTTYETVVLERSLYPFAKVFRGFLGLVPGYFSADLDFIRCVGRIDDRRAFASEEFDYVQHPDNRRFLRRRLKLRVSSRRLQRLVQEVLPPTDSTARELHRS